ncbi:MAG: tRNA uridine-5-carboxymethylaminomethyl(34) synthesis GTPase MnmE [Treponema sp.]|jgi:tRNA modification GTPase|nr:tRNA uridine-5-carboxymethylaminomethyl(34) synthesis GTPase MnmE [Treponema sp.]
MSFYGDNARIAALATPAGTSALAVIRCSGNGSIEAVRTIFSASKRLITVPSHSLVHGWIEYHGEKIDEVLLSVFHAHRSYTGEESIEISCHGGRATVQAILNVLHTVGFREALPGEFTFRAFINGKIDLIKAESVMELVSAQTDQARRRAVHRLSGSLEQPLKQLSNRIIQILAAVEIQLDYPEDELDSTVQAVDSTELNDIIRELEQLAESYPYEKLYHEGAFVVIAGSPNAGKSSLFNRLINEERSLVSAIPGTTRDWIESGYSVEGIPVRLADTAGLHSTQNEVERLGIERSYELLEKADCIIYLIDGLQGFSETDRQFLKTEKYSNVIPLWNKVDVAPAQQFKGISAKTGVGIPELGKTLASLLTNGTVYAEERVGIATERQKLCIDQSLKSLYLVRDTPDTALELVAPLLREALHAIGELTGTVSTEHLLEVMFSRFCVGK